MVAERPSTWPTMRPEASIEMTVASLVRQVAVTGVTPPSLCVTLATARTVSPKRIVAGKATERGFGDTSTPAIPAIVEHPTKKTPHTNRPATNGRDIAAAL